MFDYSDVYTEDILNNISREFTRLKDLCYLDHAGTTLYSDSQIKAYSQDLCENVYGNPHSLSTSSRYATDVVDQVRYEILKHFNTNPDEYSVVFTSGATGALKTVAECFDWSGKHSLKRTENDVDVESIGSCELQYDGLPGTFTYLQDNHTSVLGIREVAHDKGATIKCLSSDSTFDVLSRTRKDVIEPNVKYSGNSLFVYPAQCNFSGVKYPLSWVSKIQDGVLDEVSIAGDGDKKTKRSKWFCLLDAASFVATNSLDLSRVTPDFVCLSFYKIFGYPTGLGALLVRNASADVLHKSYFGGGTVSISLSSERFHVPRPILHDKFEDGTIPFLSIVSLRHGFATLRRLTVSMMNVSLHTFSLARYVHHHLVTLHHAPGSPVVRVYADTDYESSETQGGIVNFNLLRANGEHVGFVEVLNMANLYNIQLRTGCFCNPGACQRHLELSSHDLRGHFQAGHVCGDEKDLINGRPTGSVRISFGYMSTRSDADKLLDMIRTCFVDGTPVIKTPHWLPTFRERYQRKFSIESYATPNAEVNKTLKTCCLETIEGSRDVGKTAEVNGSAEIRQRETIESSRDVGKTAEVNETSEIRRCETIAGSHDVKNVPQEDGAIRLERIYVYPVKSCGSFSVERWTVGRRGLDYDREWMIVTPAGVSLTQKQDTRMCLIRPTIQVDEQQLLLDFPGLSTVHLPLRPVATSPDTESSLCQSKVCGDRIQGWDCGDDVATWLSDALQRDGLRLIRHRTSDRRVAKRKGVAATETGETSSASPKPTLSLSNQAQFLLINRGSVDWLRGRMDADASCDVDGLLQRFRSNLVVRGADALAENHWTTVQIGNNRFQSEGPCTRCQMICIDQATGEKTREPLKTLAATFQGRMRFGAYFSRVTSDEDGTIAVGDEVNPCITD